MKRRTVLRRTAAAAAVAASGLAGCTAGPGGTVSPEPTETTEEPTDSGPHPVTPTATSFAVTDRSCGQGNNAATVSVDGETTLVEGVIAGSDTCDTARLGRVELQDGQLTVVVETVKEETTGTPACGQCLTDIEYTFETTLPETQPSEVKVIHKSSMGDEVVAIEKTEE